VEQLSNTIAGRVSSPSCSAITPPAPLKRNPSKPASLPIVLSIPIVPHGQVCHIFNGVKHQRGRRPRLPAPDAVQIPAAAKVVPRKQVRRMLPAGGLQRGQRNENHLAADSIGWRLQLGSPSGTMTLWPCLTLKKQMTPLYSTH